ncbi:MAG: Asp-tRNA(Asn)/Glu-tRNA(Gln) amidotransferase subunit GatB [Verrucomicrobiia bacterium]|jgi:aspartyl-tRNA(Asn)/glutamyl-tRNA(Gln) amidotransferase subunit B
MEYEAVIGLEIHVQLKTKSKMWCSCANAFGAAPNTNVCPVCMGLPGTLPVANDEALRLTGLAGYLLNCDVPKFAKFDRKNYFYPDAPKNYQITQYDKPSTIDGFVEFEFEGGISRVGITRAHLEEDLGKNFHFDRDSGIDFNRAGVPLLEIVTEPEIRSPEQAQAFLNALKDIVIYGGVSDFDMEKGMARCDVNISVRPLGQEELNPRREIKNMNSFSGVRRALNYEIPHQIQQMESGETIRQGTVRWNDDAGITESMRSKEDAHDYRYFPEPDLMPFEPTDEWLAEVRARVVELPLARKRRFMADYELPEGDADVFVQNVPLGGYFETAAKSSKNRKAVANWVINNLRAKLVEAEMEVGDAKIKPAAIGELVELVESKRITSRNAQEAFGIMFETGGTPEAIADEQGWKPADAGEIESFCDEAIAANPGPADDVRKGKDAAVNRILGHVMKLSKGSADPGQTRVLLLKKLRG